MKDWKGFLKKHIKQVVALLLAITVVISYSLSRSSDRTLRAGGFPGDEQIELDTEYGEGNPETGATDAAPVELVLDELEETGEQAPEESYAEDATDQVESEQETAGQEESTESPGDSSEEEGSSQVVISSEEEESSQVVTSSEEEESPQVVTSSEEEESPQVVTSSGEESGSDVDGDSANMEDSDSKDDSAADEGSRETFFTTEEEDSGQDPAETAGEGQSSEEKDGEEKTFFTTEDEEPAQESAEASAESPSSEEKDRQEKTFFTTEDEASAGETGEAAAAAEDAARRQGVADTLVFKGPDYTVTASYGEDAGIPAGASLVVFEIKEEAKEYQTYCDQAQAAVAESLAGGAGDGQDSVDRGDRSEAGSEAGTGTGSKAKPEENNTAPAAQADAESDRSSAGHTGAAPAAADTEVTVSWVRLFDITIEVDGVAVEPQGPVAVQIDYGQAIEQAGNEEVNTVHFEGQEEVPVVLETRTEGSDEALEQVTFETEGFSVFAVMGTTITKKILASDGVGYQVTLTCGADAAIPADAELEVREIPEDSEIYQTCREKSGALFGTDRQVAFARFFDITILKDGREIQPAAPVEVRIELADKLEEDAQAVHFEQEAGKSSEKEADVQEAEAVLLDTSLVEADRMDSAVTFSASGFSIYGVLYTVDFHWEANGKTYEYSIPGGGYISLSDVFETLEIGESAHGSGMIEDVESAVFSDPDLVWVGKVSSESTVGELIEDNDLEVQYSSDLTEEEIEKSKARTVKAGDWALISLLPFTSEESLTVTMKNGDRFAIRVTDAQIKKTVMDARGDTWEITVTYEEDAQIPEGAELKVKEITEAAEHEAYVTKTQEALGRETDESSARFFDISIVDKDGNEIQPAAEVSVDIRLLDTEHIEDMQVVHFGETAELMDLKGDSDSLNFSTDGFSIFAVVTVKSEEGSYVFRGEGYTVTITHTAEAKIPLGTILTVEELEQGSEQFDQRLGQAWCEINREYLETAEKREHYEEWMGELPDAGLVNIDTVRFFDIRLLHEEKIIEPNVPVQVEIAYDDGMKMAGDVVSGVVHYTGEAVEVIDDVDTVTEGDTVLAFKYEQESFSDTGTYVGQKTYDEVTEPAALPAPVPMQYPMLQKNAPENVQGTAANGAARGGEAGEEEALPEPTATKTLTPNKADDTRDGTYTLELAVDGRAKSSTITEIKKSNVLIVMDRSSSMVNNYPNGQMNSTAVATRRNNRYESRNNIEFIPQVGVRYYGKVNSNGSDRYRELNYTTYTNNTGTHYRWTYVNTDDPKAAVTEYTGANIFTGTYTTRLSEEQEALSTLIRDLLGKNGEGTTDDGVRLDDLIEISVISFARTRGDKEKDAATEVDWSTDYNELMAGVNSGFAPPGTNWENAMRYAMEKVNAKKNDASQAGEDFYIIFLTDGEPTATREHDTGAYYYEGSSHGSFTKAYEAARNYVVDESGLADSDYKFYGIYTWGEDAEKIGLLKRLVNVAHGHTGAAETDYTQEEVDEDGEDDYFYNADSLSKLEEAFGKIFSLISDTVAYEQVSISDGLTTDAMTTTLVNGSTRGFQYTVYKNRIVDANGKIIYKGTPVYTVTARDNDGGDPTVAFHIDGADYPAGPKKPYTYNELQEDGTTTVEKTKYYYSVTVGTGDNAVEYKMALAEKDGDRLTWDLAAIGALENGYTYAVSFTVWPDQDAYDYVAALNNGLTQIEDSNGNAVNVAWDSGVETDANKVTDSSGKSFWKGGVSAYPSIVKYTDGTFAVLTNTDQSLKYTIAKTETVDDQETVTYDGPYTSTLPTPDPMPLTETVSRLEKVWNIDRDPSILYKYLYESRDEDGDPAAFDIGFEIKRDGEEYKQVHLPGSGTVTGDGVSYDWSAYKPEDLVEYNGKTFSRRWSQDFSIATGLMLSEDQMTARSLDKDEYTSYSYGGKKYYILETGHDLKVSEPVVGYEFDFEEPTYHPMLVDGVLMDVKFSGEGDGRHIIDMETLESDTGTGTSKLTIFNTLRGYINVKKKVVDIDGTTELESDNAEFTFEVELTNALPVFESDHIPWYGINGLYYHDEEGNYYQAEYKNGRLWVTTEEGGPYEGKGTAFNPDLASAQTVKYLVDGQEQSVTISGNRMTPSEGSEADGYKKVTAAAKITRTEMLHIANVPVNTQYTIKEVARDGYQLIGIEREVGTDSTAAGAGSVDTGIVEGEIVQNAETLITYTNKCMLADMTIQKTDPEGEGLEGAVFQLKTVSDQGHSEADAAAIDTISGIGDVVKTVDGETKTFRSSFETTGGIMTLSGLPNGTYRLYEVCVPAGYISTYQYIQFEVKDRSIINVTTNTGDTSKLDTTDNNIDLKITNIPGAALPNTGGPGISQFSLITAALGAVLTVLAAALLTRAD